MRAILSKTEYLLKTKLVGHTDLAHVGHPLHPAMLISSRTIDKAQDDG